MALGRLQQHVRKRKAGRVEEARRTAGRAGRNQDPEPARDRAPSGPATRCRTRRLVLSARRPCDTEAHRFGWSV